MDEVPLPTEEQWNSLPECLSSAAGSSFSQKESFSHADAKAAPSYKAEVNPSSFNFCRAASRDASPSVSRWAVGSSSSRIDGAP